MIERRARGVEMHFASLTLARTSAGAPHKNEAISSEVPGISRRSGTRMVVTSAAVWLRGPLQIPIPWNPIQGFIPLPLLAGSLVSPSPLPSLSEETDTQLERLGGHSLAVDQAAVTTPEFGKPLHGFVAAEKCIF